MHQIRHCAACIPNEVFSLISIFFTFALCFFRFLFICQAERCEISLMIIHDKCKWLYKAFADASFSIDGTTCATFDGCCGYEHSTASESMHDLKINRKLSTRFVCDCDKHYHWSRSSLSMNPIFTVVSHDCVQIITNILRQSLTTLFRYNDKIWFVQCTYGWFVFVWIISSHLLGLKNNQNESLFCHLHTATNTHIHIHNHFHINSCQIWIFHLQIEFDHTKDFVGTKKKNLGIQFQPNKLTIWWNLFWI